jgi:hypothetical protein
VAVAPVQVDRVFLYNDVLDVHTATEAFTAQV